MKFVKVVLGALLLMTALAACVGDRPAGTPNPDPVCDAAEDLAAALISLRQMEAVNATVDEVKISAAAAKASYDELKRELGNFSDERVAALSSAMRDLETAAEQLPEETTVANARNLLAEELEAVAVAWRALGSEIGCPDAANPVARLVTAA